MYFIKRSSQFRIRTVLVTSIFWLCIVMLVLVYSAERDLSCNQVSNHQTPQSQTQWNLSLWRSSKTNEDFRNPTDWPGEGGKPVKVPAHLKESEKSRFTENQFNIVASEMIALNRSVPDMRSFK
jgi:hypothetical protein